MNHTGNAAVTTAIEAAEILAQAIQAMPEWEEFQRAQAAAEWDAELQELLARYRQLAQAWRSAQQRGEDLTRESAIELPQVQSRIEGNEKYQRQQKAGSAAVAMLRTVNQRISAELGLDFAATAAPRGGGCCG